MEEDSREARVTRRDVLKIGGAGLLAGVLLTLGGEAVVRFATQPQALRPENGEAQSAMVIPWLPDTVKRWREPIERYSKQYQIDPNLVAIIMTIESGGDPNADSGQALGLMQITPDRAHDIATKFLHKPRSTYDLHDPETAIEFGAANLRRLADEFGKSSQGPSWNQTGGLVAAWYYGGEGASITYKHGGLNAVTDQGTHNYIRYASTMWAERHDDKSFAYRYWFDQGNGQALVHNAEKYAK